MCDCNEINPHLKIKSGGTIYKRTFKIVYCRNCKSPVKDFYYIHQCDWLKRIYCYDCLFELGLCKKCEHYYTCFV
jgi:methionyl-tRNA synthetase